MWASLGPLGIEGSRLLSQQPKKRKDCINDCVPTDLAPFHEQHSRYLTGLPAGAGGAGVYA